MFTNKKDVEKILGALGEELAVVRFSADLLVCGGSALTALGFIERATKDVDVLAFVDSKVGLTAHTATPFPANLQTAASRVADFFKLPKNWLNPGPTSALDLGLPQGLLERSEIHRFGDYLIVRFLSRLDQIHFKLYAATDQGPGKHYQDLLSLHPLENEIEAAARWSRTHDPSDGYLQELRKVITSLGFPDVAHRI